MKRSHYITLSLFIAILFLFFKIYQHNSIVKLVYEKQRLERMKEGLRKDKNKLLVQLYTIKNQEKVREEAREKFSFCALKPDQIVTYSNS